MTALQLQQVIPRNYRRSIALAFPLRWTLDRPFRLPGPENETFGPYYIDWFPGNGTLGEDWTTAPFDANGIILTPAARKYHPVRIAQFGLHNHAKWISGGSAAARETFLRQARWLRDHQVLKNGVPGCYPYDFPNPHYGAASGWLSAMAQGQAISLLLRAHDVYPEGGFLQAAMLAAEPFRYNLDAGGVTWRAGRHVFFEEIAAQPAAHILNGNIFAFWGLWELNRRYMAPWLSELLEGGLRTIRSTIGRYDSGYWSYYDMLNTKGGLRKTAVLKYHEIHIAQLRVLASMTGATDLAATAQRWECYAASPACRLRMLLNTFAGLPSRFISHTDSVTGGAFPETLP